MGFNQSQFMKQKYEPRTAYVDVPALAAFFGKDEKPQWKVRGQTASELAKTIESTATNKSISSIIEAIGNNQSQVNDLKAAIGMSNDVPDDIVKRLSQLSCCSIEPAIDHITGVKLAETFPIEFYTITNMIVELTGLGQEAAIKKPPNSGKATK